MLSHPAWIPDKIRQHPVAAWFISSATLVILTAGVTCAVINATTLGEMKIRTESLLWQNQRLTEDLKTAQARYDAEQAGRDDDISKKVSELSAGYRESIGELTGRYEKTLQENADLKNTLSTLSSADRRQAAERRESRLQELSTALALNSKQITETHRLLYETSASAGYERASCGKEDKNTFSNVCEQASQSESQARSLQQKISSLEKNGQILNGQIMALEGKPDGTRPDAGSAPP